MPASSDQACQSGALSTGIQYLEYKYSNDTAWIPVWAGLVGHLSGQGGPGNCRLASVHCARVPVHVHRVTAGRSDRGYVPG